MPRKSIQFFSEIPHFNPPNPRKTANWLKLVSRHEKQSLGILTYVFCSDEYLLSLNKQFLKHTTYTDILSFPSPDPTGVSGEIYISIPRVQENASRYQQEFDVELRRVMVHGLLHFFGYNDKGPREKAQMRRKEEACLSLWK